MLSSMTGILVSRLSFGNMTLGTDCFVSPGIATLRLDALASWLCLLLYGIGYCIARCLYYGYMGVMSKNSKRAKGGGGAYMESLIHVYYYPCKCATTPIEHLIAVVACSAYHTCLEQHVSDNTVTYIA